jgi:hypothetical protein
MRCRRALLGHAEQVGPWPPHIEERTSDGHGVHVGAGASATHFAGGGDDGVAVHRDEHAYRGVSADRIDTCGEFSSGLPVREEANAVERVPGCRDRVRVSRRHQ